jgi:glutathione synthase/RimK-type ligase-like ATP-grasp enzyme
MILILTTEAGDFSHIKIIDWLNHLGANYKIISGENILRGASNFTIQNGNVFYDGINLSKSISTVYYRRWITEDELLITNDLKLNKTLNRNLAYEMQEIKKFLFNNLQKAVWIPNPQSVIINKITVLEQAKQVEINVPDYIVTNNKTDLIKFSDKHQGEIITKAIGNYFGISTSDNFAVNPIYTKQLDKDLLNSLPKNFPPSFFQKLIKKSFEYRIFYFYGEIYPTAILSQESELTQVDSRKNDDNTESKLVPVKIEMSFKNKLINLMSLMNLNIGSIDVIHSVDNQYYFLEVNPVGQISGYSRRSGLNLEKIIAQQLIKIDTTYEKRGE